MSEKTEKEKPKPKVKKQKSSSSHYKIEAGKIKRMLPTCERCGPGYFMADHKDRFACGHCGFTRYKTEKDQ